MYKFIIFSLLMVTNIVAQEIPIFVQSKSIDKMIISNNTPLVNDIGKQFKVDAGELHERINKVCPITSVSLGKTNDKATWKFMPTKDATSEQIEAAQQVITNWGVDDWKGDIVTRKKVILEEIIQLHMKILCVEREESQNSEDKDILQDILNETQVKIDNLRLKYKSLTEK